MDHAMSGETVRRGIQARITDALARLDRQKAAYDAVGGEDMRRVLVALARTLANDASDAAQAKATIVFECMYAIRLGRFDVLP